MKGRKEKLKMPGCKNPTDLLHKNLMKPLLMLVLMVIFYQGRIISVCDDGEQNTIHLWEVNKKEGKSVLEEVKTCTLEGR